jgi:uncharacterized protein YecT (DUF1311 family)
MIHNDRIDQADEDLQEAWLNLQDAHLTLESDEAGSPMYGERLDAVMDATRKYYRVLEKLEKMRKESMDR